MATQWPLDEALTLGTLLAWYGITALQIEVFSHEVEGQNEIAVRHIE